MKQNFSGVFTKVVIACLLLGCIIFLSSFSNQDKKTSISDIPPIDTISFDSYSINNPSVIFANNFGGSKEDVLFECFEVQDLFYLLINTNSNDKVFNGETTSLILVVNKDGNIEKKKELTNEQIIDCLLFDNKFYIMYTTTILILDIQLNIIDTLGSTATNFLDTPFNLIDTKNGYVYGEQCYSLDIKDSLLVTYLNETLFLYRSNNLYVYKKGETTSSYIFEDLLNPTISFNDGFIICGVYDNQTIITKLSEDIEFSYLATQECKNKSFIIPYLYGYAVFQNTQQGVYQFMLCEHGDLIQENNILLLNMQTVLDINNETVIGLTPAGNLILTELESNTYVIINGDVSPTKVWLGGDFLFVNSSACTVDYFNNFGDSDIFMFKL